MDNIKVISSQERKIPLYISPTLLVELDKWFQEFPEEKKTVIKVGKDKIKITKDEVEAYKKILKSEIENFMKSSEIEKLSDIELIDRLNKLYAVRDMEGKLSEDKMRELDKLLKEYKRRKVGVLLEGDFYKYSQYGIPKEEKDKNKKTKEVITEEPKVKEKPQFVEPETAPIAESEKKEKTKEEKEEEKKETKKEVQKLKYGPAPTELIKPDFILTPKKEETKEGEPEYPIEKYKKETLPTVRKKHLPTTRKREIVPISKDIVEYTPEAPPPFGLKATENIIEETETMAEVWDMLKRLGVNKDEIEAMKKKYEETGDVSFLVSSKEIPLGGSLYGLAMDIKGKTKEEIAKEVISMLEKLKVPRSTIKNIMDEFLKSGKIKVTTLPVEFGLKTKRLPKRSKHEDFKKVEPGIASTIRKKQLLTGDSLYGLAMDTEGKTNQEIAEGVIFMLEEAGVLKRSKYEDFKIKDKIDSSIKIIKDNNHLIFLIKKGIINKRSIFVDIFKKNFK